MITRTLHLVDAEPSSQLCASDDDSDDDADDTQLLADLMAETQYGVSDAAIVASDMADTAIDEASDAGDEAVVASGEEAIDPSDAAVDASGVAGAEASDPSGAGVVAVPIGDPYWNRRQQRRLCPWIHSVMMMMRMMLISTSARLSYQMILMTVIRITSFCTQLDAHVTLETQQHMFI